MDNTFFPVDFPVVIRLSYDFPIFLWVFHGFPMVDHHFCPKRHAGPKTGPGFQARRLMKCWDNQQQHMRVPIYARELYIYV